MTVERGLSSGRPTIRTVAERAGVSKSLVSLVLRGAPGASPESRAAVERAVRELGYRPNAAARELRERRTRGVGVLLNDLRHPWYTDMLDGLTAVLQAHGRHLLLSGSHLDQPVDSSVARALLDTGPDGMILAGTQPNSPLFAEIAATVPTIAVGSRDIELPHVDTVAGDDLIGAALATRHLIDLGHRHIAHIAGQLAGSRNVIGQLRRQGYEDTMRAHGLADHMRVEFGDYTEDGGYRAAVRLLTSNNPPTAIFAVNDMTCLGAKSAATELRVDVPTQLSLVGYDNSDVARLRSISLTSIDGAGHDIGRQAGHTLLTRIDDPTRDAELHLLTPTLQTRASTTSVPK